MSQDTLPTDKQEFRWFRAEALRFFAKNQIERQIPVEGTEVERTEVLNEIQKLVENVPAPCGIV